MAPATTTHGRRRRAYIGSFTSAGGLGVLVAAVDEGSGALTVLGGADDVPDPSHLALSPDGGTLYAVSERPEGAVAAYRVTGDKPELTGPPVAVGGGPTHLCLHAGHVLTADYGSGGVTAVPLRPDGTLAAPASGTLRHTGSGPDPVANRSRTPTRCCPPRAAAASSPSTSARTRCGCAPWRTASPSCATRRRCRRARDRATSPSTRVGRTGRTSMC